MAITQRIGRSVANQAQHMLRTGERFKKFDEIRERDFWSTYLLSADANGYIQPGQFQVFTTPAGQAGQGFTVALTERETNWKSANRVPDNQNLMVTEIGVTVGISPVAADDNSSEAQLNANLHYQLVTNMVVAITYLTNTVPLGMASDFAQASAPGMGTYEPYLDNDSLNAAVGAQSPAVPAEAQLPRRFVSNGFCAPALRRRFKVPVLLQHGETFSWSLLVPRAFYAGTDVTYYVRFDMWAVESFVERS